MRVLAVKLADLGDVLTATPALLALHEAGHQVTVLMTPHTAPLLHGSPLAGDLLCFDKALFDSRLGSLAPRRILSATALARRLRACRFDAVALLHHLSTPWGALKYRLLCAATGAGTRAGLDNGRGSFLTERVPDHGFGVRHEVEYCLDVAAALGATVCSARLHAPVSVEDEAFASRLLPDGIRFAALHPGSGSFAVSRRWPWQRFAAVGRALAAAGARVVVVGGRGEEALGRDVAVELGGDALDVTGKTTLGQLAAVLRRCSVFVGGDSGVTHLAAAAGARVVVVFGPTNHRAWGPWTPDKESAQVVRLEMDCSPCLYVGKSFRNRLGCRERPCLLELPAERVAEAALRMLHA